MKQNDAVFQAVCSVLGMDEFDSAVELTKEQRETVVGMVTEGIISGKVDFSTEARTRHDTPAKVRSYTTGMVSNHLRKDKRLNGGDTYVIKNPGSRSKQDASIKAMRALQSQYEKDSDEWGEIEAAIDARQAELEAAKPKVEINADALPEHLRYLITK
jgi:hypothetical protein